MFSLASYLRRRFENGACVPPVPLTHRRSLITIPAIKADSDEDAESGELAVLLSASR